VRDKAAPRWTRHKETRPDEILAAAKRLFTEHGVKVTLADIAKFAGCSKACVLLYFGYKSELWRQAMGSAYYGRGAKPELTIETETEKFPVTLNVRKVAP